ncbi:MAG: ATP-binding protein [Myxococcota bacterium]|nr:ATP-binding protein [Myxococcota bacterium]
MNKADVQSTLLGWIIPLAICFSVLLRRKKGLRQRLFVLFAGNVTLYYFFTFLYIWRGEPWYERIALGVAILIPQGGLRFFRAFSTGARGMGRLGGVSAVLGLILTAAVLYPSSLRPAVGPAVMAYVGGFMLVAILNLNVQVKTATTRVDAARIRYLVVGGFLTLSFQVVDRLDHIFKLEIPPFGLAMTIIYLYVISQAIVRHRILDLYEMLGRFAVLSLMGVALAAIYTGLVFWAGAGFSINAFLASLVILIMFDPLRELVERKISDFFFRERRILEQEIAQMRRHLMHVIDIEVMTDRLIDGFENSRRITHASLYLVDAHGRGFDLKGSAGPAPELKRIEAAAANRHIKSSNPSGAILAVHLQERREHLLQQGDRDIAQSIGESIEFLKELQADAVLTIEGDDHLLGLLSLKDERLKDPFSPEDIALLKGLTVQIATGFEGSRIYQQIKERDRLAALGKMAAGLAHEIRNPLGSLKGAAQVIGDTAQSSGGIRDGELLGVIVEEVDRLNRVVSDFLTYARPGHGQPRMVNVNDILRRTLQLFETSREGPMHIVVDLAEDLPGCKVDGEQLHQVFLNLILNAQQAMAHQPTQRIDVTTRTRVMRLEGTDKDSPAKPVHYVEMRFSDNGPGIDLKTLENIFIPFFTTKEKGSGLGLAICQRIVRDAGGEIEVRSQPGQGTIFTVILPGVKNTDIEIAS